MRILPVTLPVAPLTLPFTLPVAPLTLPVTLPVAPLTLPVTLPVAPLTLPVTLPVAPLTLPATLPVAPLTLPVTLPVAPLTLPITLPVAPLTLPVTLPVAPLTLPVTLPVAPLTLPITLPVAPLTLPITLPVAPPTLPITLPVAPLTLPVTLPVDPLTLPATLPAQVRQSHCHRGAAIPQPGGWGGHQVAPVMQTPASMVTGIVCAPLGLVLVFTAAITPQWREGRVRLGGTGQGGGAGGGAVEGATLLRSDGLWESCLQVVESELKQCWPASGAYQQDQRVRWARGLVLGSLTICGLGIALASVGIRCWTDFPLRNVAGASGVLIALSGLLSLSALALYAHNLQELGLGAEPPPAATPPGGAPGSAPLQLQPAGSLYFGWVGGCVLVLGGAVLSLSFKRPRCALCYRPAATTESYEVEC
ncbi:hypothetical protein JZ751_011387 [Albula glossodonta]|uniref:Claudin n=1 Tax=Albula glossodonta TaxID=121402 RepID=A0A8T2N4U8_9TELE|nr:hypothetical protein JZ751_011387 [Albula glossodonta]